VRAGSLTLYDLGRRRRVGARRLNAGPVTAIALTAAGSAAWIERHGGLQEVRRLGGDTLDGARDIDPAFLYLKGDTVSYREGDYVRLGFYRHERAADTTSGSLGRAGDVRLVLAGGRIGASYADGPWITLGSPQSDPEPDGGEGNRGGIDALRINGSWIAARDNGYEFQTGLHGSVTVFDLTGATPPRTLCRMPAVDEFRLSAQGGVTCQAATASA
jgi:hypothetical protein